MEGKEGDGDEGGLDTLPKMMGIKKPRIAVEIIREERTGFDFKTMAKRTRFIVKIKLKNNYYF